LLHLLAFAPFPLKSCGFRGPHHGELDINRLVGSDEAYYTRFCAQKQAK
jgi:hypothetical protein